jgi:hypothetical protein
MATDNLLRVEDVAKLVCKKGRKSKGINPSTLRNWLEDSYFERLRAECEVDPAMLNIHGKPKGGRGNKKPGWQLSWSKGCGPWFPDLENQLDEMISSKRKGRVKVTGVDVKEWMNALVSDAARKEEQAGKEADPRKLNWKCSGKWLRDFLKRKGWVYRRATNKRSHSAEDLLGDVLAWVRFLRQIRRDHPNDSDPIWGIFGPRNTFNADSVPIVFASTCKITIDRKGAVRVSIIVPGSGLDKRQASLHVAMHGGKGPQAWPTVVLKGACTADGKPDTKKRAAEMALYAKYKVHVLWQTKAWFSLETAMQWAKCFEGDLKTLGLEDAKTLLMCDNLGSQRAEEFRAALKELNCRVVYGPKNGTDIWQPVDHGIGRAYQVLIAKFYDEWTKSQEATNFFRVKKAPPEPRRRELMVKWVHDAYMALETERADREKDGKHSRFQLAFFRTGALVSANGDRIDNEINPEGLEKAMACSDDPYYKQHNITSFQDLLACSDGCDHSEDANAIPNISQNEVVSCEAKLLHRAVQLEGSTDPRAELIMKCLRAGYKWAGSALLRFISHGLEELLRFLSECNADGSPAHDLDFYRDSKDVQALGKRFVGLKVWNFEKKIQKQGGG